jgi:hypothetical protein
MQNITGTVKNNIFFISAVPGMGHDFNWYSGATTQGEAGGVAGGANDPFVDLGNNNLRIKDTISTTMPRNKGVALGQVFLMDKDGNPRGTDGFWDIGAYENVSGRPAAPRNLRVLNQ